LELNSAHQDLSLVRGIVSKHGKLKFKKILLKMESLKSLSYILILISRRFMVNLNALLLVILNYHVRQLEKER